MKVTKLPFWADFESEVAALFTKVKSKRHESEMYVSDPLFRRHRDASWTLQTTLERYANHEYTVADYYRLLLAVRPAITSLTKRSWELGEYEFEEEERPGPPPGYEFMIYVRHHGLPSPLLDWTHSPYVAAFFAFRLNQCSEADEVAIYSYTEYYAAGKTYSPNLPTIVGLGPYVVTHRRHYNQQCAYIICSKRSQERYVYCSHEDALEETIIIMIC